MDEPVDGPVEGSTVSDDEAWTAWVRLRYPALLRRGYLLVGDRAGAQDLVQEALARTWGASRRRPVEHLDAYVATTLTHLAVSRWRRRRRGRETPMEQVPEVEVVDPTLGTGVQLALWQVLQALPPRQRAVVVLRYYEDLGERQVADLLGISVGTVRSTTHRALARLRLACGPDLAPAAPHEPGVSGPQE